MLGISPSTSWSAGQENFCNIIPCEVCTEAIPQRSFNNWSKSEWNMNETFGFLTIWGDNKVDVVSTAMAIEVSSSRENEYVSEWPSLFRSVVISALRNQWRSAMDKRMCLGNFQLPCVTALHISCQMKLTKRATFGVVTWVFFPVRIEVRNWSSYSGKEKFRSFRYFAVGGHVKLLPSLSNISLISCLRREALSPILSAQARS